MSISNLLSGQDVPRHDVKSVMTQNGRTFASYSDGSTLITSNTPGEYPVGTLLMAEQRFCHIIQPLLSAVMMLR